MSSRRTLPERTRRTLDRRRSSAAQPIPGRKANHPPRKPKHPKKEHQ